MRLAIILTATLVLLFPTPSRADDPVVPPERLAAREWFQDAKFGVFIHWGVYSVLERGEWVMHREQMTTDEYRKVALRFDPTDYDPAAWADLFRRAGARYVTITSKHHDGLAMWDSPASEWDVVDSAAYGKDILKPLSAACEAEGLRLMFYHSHLDWTHPDYFPRGKTGQHSGRPESGDFDRYLDHMNTQLAELLGGDYGSIAGVWFDGWWDQRDGDAADPRATHVDWRLSETYDLIHRLQPACLIGNNHHVAVFPGEDFQMFERDLPGQATTHWNKDAVVGELPLETCDTINGAWGYNAGDKNYKSPRELIHYLVRAAGMNANFLLNVGPKPDGTIPPELVERLEAIGAWLQRYGESIYSTRGGPMRPAEWGVMTSGAERRYVHVLTPPEPDADGYRTLRGAGAHLSGRLRLLASREPVETRRNEAGELCVRLPESASDAIDTVLVGGL